MVMVIFVVDAAELQHAQEALQFIKAELSTSLEKLPRASDDMRNLKAALASFDKEIESTASSIKIELKLSDTELFVKADKIQIELVILSLLRNIVGTMRDSPPLLTIQTEAADNHLTLVSVADNGNRFEENNIEKSLKTYLPTQADSIDMGLWICRNIIESHKGKLTAKALPGNGVCFTITLPLLQATNHG